MRYSTQLIPRSRPQRPGYALKPTSLTVHNTANPNATAANHADWLGGSNTRASAHIFVDDVEAVLVIPLNEQAWHAGINAGNTTSVGIEVCEFSDRARQDKTDDNAQELIAAMLSGTAPVGFNLAHLDLDDVRTHQSWKQYGPDKPGKYCPRMILPWWDRFVAEIGVRMEGGTDVLDCFAITAICYSAAALERFKGHCAPVNLNLKAPAIITIVPGHVYAVETHARAAKGETLQGYIKADPEMDSFKGIPTSASTVASIGVVKDSTQYVPPACDASVVAELEARGDRSVAAAQEIIRLWNS